jgi:hypothetical protein
MTRYEEFSILFAEEPTHDYWKNFLRDRGHCPFCGGNRLNGHPESCHLGLFCIALGLLLDAYDFGFRRRG